MPAHTLATSVRRRELSARRCHGSNRRLSPVGDLTSFRLYHLDDFISNERPSVPSAIASDIICWYSSATLQHPR